MRRRLVVEETLRLCFTLDGIDESDIVAVGNMHEWWVDAHGARFYWRRVDGPTIYCRALEESIPDELNVTMVNRDSLAVLAPQVVGDGLDDLPGSYRSTEDVIEGEGVSVWPMEFLGLPVLVVAEGQDFVPRRVMAVELTPRPGVNERLILNGCTRDAVSDEIVLATFNRRDRYLAKAWVISRTVPVLTELDASEVVCEGVS